MVLVDRFIRALARTPLLADRLFTDAERHTVSGNPGRFRTGEVALRPDDRWRQEQRIGPRLTVTALALPLLHRYGYPVSVAA